FVADEAEVKGVQITLTNWSKGSDGIQLAFANLVKEFNGLQMALANVARDSGVFQIGILNFARQNSECVQLGLLNFNDGFLPFFPIFNLSL
ncbi:MAG: hypothetical protein K9M56_07075, partial [Victivallales bacterium]|nr:hypothetical protein [Victivallales bacterium]